MTRSNLESPYLIDTSVLVKWFIEEHGSENAIRLRNKSAVGNIDIATTELAYYELANALRNSRLLPEAEIHRAVEDLRAERIHVVPFDMDALHIAIENAVEYEISIYDAYFVALADLEGMTLVTADEKLVAKVSGRSAVIALQDLA
ncbi:MAG: type II toxin-antitoxin system VapC family toxin [Actinomycetota bacterium]